MAKKTTKKKIVKGRPMPQSPTAGYLASGRRYGNGGKKNK